MTNKIFRINIPVADLRKEPVTAALPSSLHKDPLQESQLLFGEAVCCLDEAREWVFIEAVEQQRFTGEKRWCNYQGWILKTQITEDHFEASASYVTISSPWANIYSELSVSAPVLIAVSQGTRLSYLDCNCDWTIVRLPNGKPGAVRSSLCKKPSRKSCDILESLTGLMGQPYLWGGRSAYRPDWPMQRTGSDCSGLVNLLYRVQGIDIPRDAHDQFLKCVRKEFLELERGDLIFSAEEERVSHVMIFAGEDEFVDTSMTQGKLIQSSAKDRFGKPFCDIKWGERVGDKRFYFGAVSLSQLS
jgi:hypothetical protein